MTEHVKLHISYDTGPFKDDDPILAGEGPWGRTTDVPNVYVVDNLLFATSAVGYGDLVRCDKVTIDGHVYDNEIVEVVTSVPCWRGVVLPAEGADAQQLADVIRTAFPDEGQLKISGGLGAINVQFEPGMEDAVEAVLDSTDLCAGYELEPSPGLAFA